MPLRVARVTKTVFIDIREKPNSVIRIFVICVAVAVIIVCGRATLIGQRIGVDQCVFVVAVAGALPFFNHGRLDAPFTINGLHIPRVFSSILIGDVVVAILVIIVKRIAVLIDAVIPDFFRCRVGVLVRIVVITIPVKTGWHFQGSQPIQLHIGRVVDVPISVPISVSITREAIAIIIDAVERDLCYCGIWKPSVVIVIAVVERAGTVIFKLRTALIAGISDLAQGLKHTEFIGIVRIQSLFPRLAPRVLGVHKRVPVTIRITIVPGQIRTIGIDSIVKIVGCALINIRCGQPIVSQYLLIIHNELGPEPEQFTLEV